MIFRLGGRRRGGERAAVKAAAKGDDLVPLLRRVQSSELDSGLVGLLTRVTEERLPAETSLGESLCPLPLGLGIPSVRHVNKCRDLLLHGPHDRLGAMAQQIAPPTGKKIQIAIAVAVPDVRSLAPHEHDRKSRVIGNDELAKLLDDFVANGRVGGRHKLDFR